jgi:N-acetylglucosaminyldiphosphoundecaprenol N-acetyl-beta-D-mannosaminyltransferase
MLRLLGVLLGLMEKTDVTLDDLKIVKVLGVRIYDLSVPKLLNVIVQSVLSRKKIVVANVNVHAMNIAYQLAWFRDFLNESAIVFCDGFGVKWGARILGHPIAHRYTPPDWLPLLCETCIQYNFSLFFLGARPGVAEKAASQLKKQYPDVRIVGTYHGYFVKALDNQENKAVVEQINAVAPDVLVVGFGMPLQERWVLENWQHLDAYVAIPVGAAFDYIAGEVYRVPSWMTDHGFEWLGRLIVEPRRLWKRYIIGNPLFLWRVIKQRLGLLHFDET